MADAASKVVQRQPLDSRVGPATPKGTTNIHINKAIMPSPRVHHCKHRPFHTEKCAGHANGKNCCGRAWNLKKAGESIQHP
jgi:hypothetical protein